MICKYLFPFCELSFTFLMVFIEVEKLLILSLVYVVVCSVGVISKTALPNLAS